jgi:hypothetical protein
MLVAHILQKARGLGPCWMPSLPAPMHPVAKELYALGEKAFEIKSILESAVCSTLAHTASICTPARHYLSISPHPSPLSPTQWTRDQRTQMVVYKMIFKVCKHAEHLWILSFSTSTADISSPSWHDFPELVERTPFLLEASEATDQFQSAWAITHFAGSVARNTYHYIPRPVADITNQLLFSSPPMQKWHQKSPQCFRQCSWHIANLAHTRAHEATPQPYLVQPSPITEHLPQVPGGALQSFPPTLLWA